MTANISLDTAGTALPSDQCHDLGETLQWVSLYMDHRATEVGAVWPPVRVLLADDFAGAVQGVLDRLNGPNAMPTFGTMRMGGTVAAKTMPDPEVDGGTVIVANVSLVTLGDPDVMGVPIITRTFLLAHELSHVLIESTRMASGARDSLQPPAGPSEHFARGMVVGASDEYRADMIAAEAIAELCFVVSDTGERSPGTPIATSAVNFLGCVVDDLPALHPLLPDTVDRYRRYELSLDDMWSEVQRQTSLAFVLLAHAQALMDSTLPGKHNLLLADNLASRASDLYLRDAWGAIHAVLAQGPVLPSAADHARVEPVLLDVGVRAINDVWGLLGVTVTPQGDGTEYLNVGEPLR